MTTNIDAPGWTTPLRDDGWVGERQKFPTAAQTVLWVRCPTCGADRGEYCSLGRRDKKTGELLSLEDWLDVKGENTPAPSCDFRRRDARKELRKRQGAEERRQKQLRKAMDNHYEYVRTKTERKRQEAVAAAEAAGELLF